MELNPAWVRWLYGGNMREYVYAYQRKYAYECPQFRNEPLVLGLINNNNNEWLGWLIQSSHGDLNVKQSAHNTRKNTQGRYLTSIRDEYE